MKKNDLKGEKKKKTTNQDSGVRSLHYKRTYPTYHRHPHKITPRPEHGKTFSEENSALLRSLPAPGLPAAISGRTPAAAAARRRRPPPTPVTFPCPAPTPAAAKKEGPRSGSDRKITGQTCQPSRAGPTHRSPSHRAGACPQPGLTAASPPARGAAPRPGPRPRPQQRTKRGAGPPPAKSGPPCPAGDCPRLAPRPHSRQPSPSWRPGRWREAAPTCCCRTYTGLRGGQRDTGQERGRRDGRRAKRAGEGGRGAGGRAAAGAAAAAGGGRADLAPHSPPRRSAAPRSRAAPRARTGGHPRS